MKKGNTFITEAHCLLIITKVFKNGKVYADEITNQGIEEVEYTEDENDLLIGNSYFVYGVVDKNNNLIIDRTSFYSSQSMTKSVVNEINKSITEHNKPYKIEKFYLFNTNL